MQEKFKRQSIAVLLSFALIIMIILGEAYWRQTTSIQSSPQELVPKTAPELRGIAAYINAPESFSIEDLLGKKIILIDFWTYSCINCQRVIPYVREWHERYKEHGLVVVGVHTPEFSFEEKYENVLREVERWGITYPVALDNSYETWRAYGNRYWPQMYLVDLKGNIILEHIGEGGYPEIEKKVREALQQRKIALGEASDLPGPVTIPQDAEFSDLTKRPTPEIYLGSVRNERLGGGEPLTEGIQKFSPPAVFYRDIVYLEGTWRFSKEFAAHEGGVGKISLRFKAGKVFFVAEADQEISALVLLDGKPLIENRGGSLDSHSRVSIKEPGLYRLIEGLDGESEHLLEIIPEREGLRAYTFTFGS